MMTSRNIKQKRFAGWLRRGMGMVAFCLLSSIAAATGTAASPRVVKVWGAPEAALQALRVAQPELIWLSEAGAAGNPPIQVQIAWQQEAYQRALAGGSRAPVLILSQQANPEVRLRSQDAFLIWGPPLAQQVQLVRRLMPQARRIGVLCRQSASVDTQSLSSPGVSVLALPVDVPLSARALAEAAEQVDVLIASNDEVLFNRDSAKLILLTAYRHQRAVIGPTPAFVSAGAVATQAVPKSALIAAIVARVAYWQASGHLGDSQQVTRFAPVFNVQVARSLGISIAPDLLEAQP